MGRSGGGGGHFSGGHGGSHHHSSHHSSGGFRSSSSFHSGPRGGGYSGGYGGGPRYGYGYRTRYYGPGYGYPAPPRPRYYRRRSSGGSCLSSIVAYFIVMTIMVVIVAGLAGNGGGTTAGNNLTEYAEKQYKSIFNGREDGMLMVITEDDAGEIVYGTKTNGIMDRYVDSMWNYYDANYNDDLGIQIQGMFFDTIVEMRENGDVKAIKSDKGFSSDCCEDHLNWVDTHSNLEEGCREFYNETGIQPYIMFVKNKTVNKATNKSSGVLKTLIIAVAVILVVSLLFAWWKKKVAQKNKEQEDLERTLKTPLETFGSTPLDDLKAKYDDNSNSQG